MVFVVSVGVKREKRNSGETKSISTRRILNQDITRAPVHQQKLKEYPKHNFQSPNSMITMIRMIRGSAAADVATR